MTAVPSHDFDVPEIFVQDESESPHAADQPSTSPLTPIDRPSFDGGHDWSSPGPSPRSGGTGRSTGSEMRDSSPGAAGSTARGTLRNRSDSIQISPSASPTRSRAGTMHRPSPGAISTSTTSGGRDEWRFADALQRRPSSPGHLSVGDANSDGAGGRSRANSAVSAQDVLDVLDNSAWGESIRRSFTMRRTSENTAAGAGGGSAASARAGRSSTVSHRRRS